MRISTEQRPRRRERPHHAEFGRHAGFADVRQRHARIVGVEDRVVLRIEAIVVHAQARNQSERAVSEADLVLHVQGGRCGLAHREVAHGERIRRHDRRAHAGQRERAQTVALLPCLGTCEVQAIDQVVANRGAERLAEIRLETIGPLVEIELALADVAQRRRRQRAFLARVLGGLAVLAVDLPVQTVGECRRKVVPLMREGDARTRLVVARDHAIVGGARQRLIPLLGQQIGIGIVLVAFHRQAEPLSFARCKDQLRQQAAAVPFLRIRQRARGTDATDIALVLGLLALPVAHADQAAPALAAEGRGGVAEQAVPAAVEAEAEAEVRILAVIEIVRRILGDERHDAAERIRAVQRTGRPAHDLDLLQRVQVDEVAARVGEAADRERVRYRNAIGLDAYAIAFQAADAEATQAEAAEAGGHGHAGLIAHQCLDVADQAVVQFLAIDDADRVRHIRDGALAARGGNLDARQFIRIGAGGRGRSRIGGGSGMGMAGKGQPHGRGEQRGTHHGVQHSCGW